MAYVVFFASAFLKISCHKLAMTLCGNFWLLTRSRFFILFLLYYIVLCVYSSLRALHVHLGPVHGEPEDGRPVVGAADGARGAHLRKPGLVGVAVRGGVVRDAVG